MTIDEALAVLPGLKEHSAFHWCATGPGGVWHVMVAGSEKFGVQRIEIWGNGWQMETMFPNPSRFRAALKAAGVIQ